MEIIKIMTNIQEDVMRGALLYYAAAGTTAIAGILHLLLVPNVISFNVKIIAKERRGHAKEVSSRAK
jgi:hypothetical protein